MSEPTSIQEKDWRRVVGVFADSEVMPLIDAEGQAIRAAEREEARKRALEHDQPEQ